MVDDKERLLKEILDELKRIRQDVYNVQKELKELDEIKYEVKEIKRKIR